MKVREYRQTARAASTDRTHSAILDALDVAFLEHADGFTLEQVAAGAGTSVQTVLRHYRSKEGLLAAGATRARAQVQAGRDLVPVGDLPAIASYLDQHYEETGPFMLRLLPAESRAPAVADLLDAGRVMHRTWVTRVLAPSLHGLTASARRRRVALLVVATDLLTWRLLRLEQGLSRPAYRAAVIDLLSALRPVPESRGGRHEHCPVCH